MTPRERLGHKQTRADGTTVSGGAWKAGQSGTSTDSLAVGNDSARFVRPGTQFLCLGENTIFTVASSGPEQTHLTGRGGAQSVHTYDLLDPRQYRRVIEPFAETGDKVHDRIATILGRYGRQSFTSFDETRDGLFGAVRQHISPFKIEELSKARTTLIRYQSGQRHDAALQIARNNADTLLQEYRALLPFAQEVHADLNRTLYDGLNDGTITPALAAGAMLAELSWGLGRADGIDHPSPSVAADSKEAFIRILIEAVPRERPWLARASTPGAP